MSKLDKLRAQAQTRVSGIVDRFTEVSVRGIHRFRLDLIDPDPTQPRREFDEADLERLAQSIRKQGILQPLLLRRVGERFTLIAGERRWRAAQLAGEVDVPAMLRDDLTPEAILDAQLVENLERSDLNPYERTLGVLRLISMRSGLDQERVLSELKRRRDRPNRPIPDTGIRDGLSNVLDEVFAQFGIAETTFSRFYLKLLSMHPEVLEAVRAERVPYSVGILINGVSNPKHRAKLLEQAIGSRLSRRAVQDLIRKPGKLNNRAVITSPIDLRRTRRSLTGIRKQLDDLDPNLQIWVTEQITAIQRAIQQGRAPETVTTAARSAKRK
jgi:ParB family chromosome partitioning protein